MNEQLKEIFTTLENNIKESQHYESIKVWEIRWDGHVRGTWWCSDECFGEFEAYFDEKYNITKFKSMG